MSSKYFATVYDIVKPIATFLHPIRVEGLENVPKEGPVLLCPNHSSNWDPILLICALGREANLQIMGKNQLFKIPILRTFLRKMGVFPVDRGHSDIGAVKRSIQALKDGFMLMVFPEGTRVRKKNRGARPKGGVAMMNYSISDTAEYGEYVSGTRVLPYEETKANMKAVLRDIQDGTFAGKWIAENKNGRTFFNSKRALLAQHPMETVGAELRKNMLWGDDVDPDTASN